MIYITGDCHFDFSKLNFKNFPEARDLTKEDVVIICGDFGIGPWNNNEKEDEYWLNWLEDRPFTVAFCDGNHENYDTLDAFPVHEWKGGKVHMVRDHVIHLMRGQVFTLEGKTFWVFGGARSHDITDGILEPDDPHFKKKRHTLDQWGGLYRINHQTWWAREMPSEEEFEEGMKNLAEYGNRVDFIISHTVSGSVQEMFLLEPENNELTAYFDRIASIASYDRWYFGHYHADRDLDERHTLLYEHIITAGAGADDDLGKAGAFQRGQRVRFMPDETLGRKKREGETWPVTGTILSVNRIGGGLWRGVEPTADIRGYDRHIYKHVPLSRMEKM